MQQSYINYSHYLPPLAPSQIYIPNNYQSIQPRNPVSYSNQLLPNASILSRNQNPEYQQRIIKQKSFQKQININSPSKNYAMLQNSQLIINPDRWNLMQQNTLANPSNFPFGKGRIQLSNYVTQKMQSQDDQQNKRILQKFRIDAIKNRNQRVMKHLGKIPYITQSMMSGSSIDAYKYIQKQQPQNRNTLTPTSPIMPIAYVVDPMHAAYFQPKTKRVQTVGVSANISYEESQKVMIPRRLGQSTSVGIQVNFQQEFPLQPKKKHKKGRKRRVYTIQQQQESRSMNKIQKMIHQINKKLKKNSRLLEQSLENVSLSHSRTISENQEGTKKFDYSRRNYFEESSINKKQLLPSVVYSEKNKKAIRSKTQISNQRQQKQTNENNRKSFIKDHLQLLRENRKRMEDLDQYVFKL